MWKWKHQSNLFDSKSPAPESLFNKVAGCRPFTEFNRVIVSDLNFYSYLHKIKKTCEILFWIPNPFFFKEIKRWFWIKNNFENWNNKKLGHVCLFVSTYLQSKWIHKANLHRLMGAKFGRPDFRKQTSMLNSIFIGTLP